MTAPWWGALRAEPQIRKKRPLRRKWIRLEVLPVLQNGHEHGRLPQRGVGQQRSFGPLSDGAANPAGHRSDCSEPARAAWRPPRTGRCTVLLKGWRAIWSEIMAEPPLVKGPPNS